MPSARDFATLAGNFQMEKVPCSVWAKIPGGRTDSMAFCMELWKKAGVIVTPGASFGPHGEGYVRFALVLPPEKIREAVEAIGNSGITVTK